VRSWQWVDGVERGRPAGEPPVVLDFLSVQLSHSRTSRSARSDIEPRITAPSLIAMTASTPPYCAWMWGGGWSLKYM